MIDGENSRDWNTNGSISIYVLKRWGIIFKISFSQFTCIRTYVDSVAVSGVERIPFFWKEVLDVAQASDLEFFGLLFDDFAMKGADERRRVK